MPITIAEWLQYASECIDSDSARLDAELLLSYALKKPRSYLFSWSEETMELEQQKIADGLLHRRKKGEPIAYILRQQDFWSHTFRVSAATLIPRPDTEVLVEQALALLPRNTPQHIADLGTGTGCIAISIALERPQWRVIAVDQSIEALAIAQHNADKLKASNVECHQSNWCDVLEDQKFDLIVSNPPYIREQDEHLSQGDVRFEPRSALTAGDDGLDDIRTISKQASCKLKPDGYLLLEFGYDQADDVSDLLKAQGYHSIIRHKDLAGITRAISARRTTYPHCEQ